MTSLKRLFTGLLSLLGLALPVKASAMTLEEAQVSEFFRWFHLEQVETHRNAQGADIRLFRPQGEKFRPLAAVELTLGARNRISGMRLLLARSFIADPQNSSFARDIAKSFILFAVPRADAPALKDLVDEIQFRDLKGTVLMRGEPPKLPSEPSPAYRAFAGEQPEARLALPGAEITFRNGGNGRDGELAIAVAPRGS